MTRKTFDIQVTSSLPNNPKIKIDNIKFVSKILLPNGIEIYCDPHENINIRVRNKDRNVLFGMMAKLNDNGKQNGIIKKR